MGCVLTGSGTYEMPTSLLDAAGIPCNMAYERKPCCSSSHSSLLTLEVGWLLSQESCFCGSLPLS